MATVEETPLMATFAHEFFPCVTLGCTSKPFPTKANLKRHMRAVHGPLVKMRCGKLLKDHFCNIRRHQRRCHACLRKPVGTEKVPSMTKPRRSERLSQHVQQVIIARAVDGTPAQNELSGCVTPNEVYLHAPENETRDTSYDDGVNAPLHGPVLDTIYAYPYGFPGGDFTWTGPISTWDEVTNVRIRICPLPLVTVVENKTLIVDVVQTTPQDPGARSIHSDPSS
ncbi:hypothetical protein CCUS01_09715 [Colletotrichum cuscutae]|uniref:C2H2-type domain-containing protein n=1 Tax=Colletotrichum cuscutae TaxID=1209917 RepID=A0AAI9UHV2_9PEZI|nr:hypothetical protein CCUS01_09715 [Colletotrichum cuscutae]